MAFGPKMSRCDQKYPSDAFFFATGHTNGTIILWDTNGVLITKFIDHQRSITSFVFTPRKTGMVQLLSVAMDGNLKVKHIQN